MTRLNKRASLALADLTASLNRWLEAEIAALPPGEREHFDLQHTAGLSRYDALLAARDVIADAAPTRGAASRWYLQSSIMRNPTNTRN